MSECVDHWHCDPRLAAHACDAADRSNRCPTCGEHPMAPNDMDRALAHAALKMPRSER